MFNGMTICRRAGRTEYVTTSRSTGRCGSSSSREGSTGLTSPGHSSRPAKADRLRAYLKVRLIVHFTLSRYVTYDNVNVDEKSLKRFIWIDGFLM